MATTQEMTHAGLLGRGLKASPEMVKLSRIFDWLVVAIVFLAVLAGFHIHSMLTVGDWDFWVDWKDREYWVTFTPVLLITFPAAMMYVFWEKFRLPIGATLCAVALVLGQWATRYFGFHTWSYFPMSFIWPATIIPGALVLDMVLMWTGSGLLTAIVGGWAFGLIFAGSNWPMLAAFHLPVEVMKSEVASVADLIGYSFTRTATPEYLRMIERGTLRTFGGHSTAVAAFFSGFMCILMFLVWWYIGMALAKVVTVPNRIKQAMGL
jgi:methane/ammonia monooxygenase subunit A